MCEYSQNLVVCDHASMNPRQTEEWVRARKRAMSKIAPPSTSTETIEPPLTKQNVPAKSD